MILFPTFRAACGPRGPICAADFYFVGRPTKKAAKWTGIAALHLKQLGKKQKRWAAIQDKVATREAAWKEISSHFVFVWFVSCFDINKVGTSDNARNRKPKIATDQANKQAPIKSEVGVKNQDPVLK